MGLLDDLPRRGFVVEPSPVTPLPDLARDLGLGWLGAKRDDRLPALHGGTKVRKLDALLAAPPWRDAPRWTSVGAIGSGHLVALTAAARDLGRHLDADVFAEPLGPEVLDNLAFVASGPTTLRFHSGRVALALRRARALLGFAPGWIPPGATSPLGALGVALGALEVAEQVARGEMPAPDDVFVACGSGGTAAGLAVGFGLVGLRCTVHAVGAVEPPLLPRRRLDRLVAATRAEVARLTGRPAPEAAPIEVVRGQVGRGYGHPTEAGTAAVARVRGVLPLEPVYGAKAMAGLIARAPDLAGRNVLFWVTSHGGTPAPSPDWRDRLPPALARHLARGPSRRGLLVGAVAIGAVLLLGRRVTGYALPGWEGAVLARWEAEVVAAIASTLLPDAPGGPIPGPSPEEVARNVDRYLRGMPAGSLAEIHGLMALLEHGTALGGRFVRLTRLAPDDRAVVLGRLSRGPLRDAWKGIRDLCLLALWQDDRAWGAIGYGGPWVRHDGPRRADGLPAAPSAYDALVAPPGALPKGVEP